MDVPADLTKSFMAGFKDAEEARKAWQEITQEGDRAERDRKIRILQSSFPDVREELIEQALEEANWDVDEAVIPLFQAIEKERSEKQRQQYELERQERQKEANKRAKSFLSNLFSKIPEEKIQAMLDENEGDIDATTDQLLQLVREEEEQKAKEKERADTQRKEKEAELKRKQLERERTLKLRTCIEKFDEYISEEEIKDCLEKNDWDLAKVTLELLEITEDRKVEQLHRLYKSLSKEEVRQVIEQEKWDMISAMGKLREIRNEKRKSSFVVPEPTPEPEPVAIVPEPTPEPKREPEPTSEPVKVVPEPTPEPVAVVPEPKPEPEIVNEPDSAVFDSLQAPSFMETKNENALHKSKEKRSEDLLMRSVIIAKELSERVANEQDEEFDIKNALKERLRFGPGDVPGCNVHPGLIPLTPKIIDEMRRPKPFESQVIERAPVVEQEPPVPVRSEGESDSDLLVVSNSGQESKITLKVSPTKFDIGTSITVEWESSENTTPYDWLGLYLVESSVKQYIKSCYIEKNARKGTVTFTPAYFGEYNVRYFTNGYNLLATSDTVTVAPEYDVDITYDQEKKTAGVRVTQKSGKMYTNLWVGVYDSPQADNKSYYTYDWMTNAVDNTLTFVLPKACKWEFRLFPLKSYIDVARYTLTVQGEDRVVLSNNGTETEVECNIQTVDFATESVWVGIYAAGETNERMYKRYKHVPNPQSKIVFRTPLKPGSYEARILTGYKPLVRSNVISV